ncbi:DUF1015 family protein [Streptomyces sp. NPDC002132]|uniref:DUF1015 family protein n=1 Tax=unclassified Streptomyces TaxID=2593676 RepID=UPI0033289232
MRTSVRTPHPADTLDRGAPTGLDLHPFLGIRRSRHAFARDHVPAYYVLEQRRGPTLLQRGVIGALDLGSAQRAVHPHEQVFADKVATQRTVLRAVGGNPEPILLACRGTEDVHSVLARITEGAPDTAVTGPDGSRHLLWRCTDPDRRNVIAAGLSRHGALLADGHHRLAAALEHRRSFGGRPGPWDRLLALLVDTSRHPLELRAIHRRLPGLPAEEAAARAAAVATVEEVTGVGPPPAPAPGGFVLIGSGRRWSVRDVCPRRVRAALHGCPDAWVSLDVAVLHYLFIGRVWRIGTGVPGPAYVHDPAEATAEDTLVLLAPPREDEIHRLAADGVLMPQKTTAFGPKPLPWLVTYHHGHQTRSRPRGEPLPSTTPPVRAPLTSVCGETAGHRCY